MTITLTKYRKGQCYAVKFDRYRQQVVDKLKDSRQPPLVGQV